jgi:hypothetical protein
MANVIIELFWLQLLLKELGIKLAAASILWCDNIGATCLAIQFLKQDQNALY